MSWCLSFDAGMHLNRCDVVDDHDSNAACEQQVVIPCWSFMTSLSVYCRRDRKKNPLALVVWISKVILVTPNTVLLLKMFSFQIVKTFIFIYILVTRKTRRLEDHQVYQIKSFSNRSKSYFDTLKKFTPKYSVLKKSLLAFYEPLNFILLLT